MIRVSNEEADCRSKMFYLQVNTEPAKSKSFSLVVNQEEVESWVGSEESVQGRTSEGAVSRGEIPNRGEIPPPQGFVLGGDLAESEVLVRGGLEANTLESSEEEMSVVVATNKEEEEKLSVAKVEEEVEKEVEKEKQSRSIVSVRLGEEGNRFSFAKVMSFSNNDDNCHEF